MPIAKELGAYLRIMERRNKILSKALVADLENSSLDITGGLMILDDAYYALVNKPEAYFNATRF